MSEQRVIEHRYGWQAGHGGNEHSLLDYAEMLAEPFDAQVVSVRGPYDVHRDGYCWFRVNSFVPEPNDIVQRDLPGIIDEVTKLGYQTTSKTTTTATARRREIRLSLVSLLLSS